MTKKTTIPASDDPAWGLFYRESTKNMDARKSIKVKLPIRHHIKLHAMKLFTENNISETVERALDAYFKQMKEEQDGIDREEARIAGELELGGVVDGVTATEGDEVVNE